MQNNPMQNPWRAPRLTLRFWPVFLRNLLVWRKLAIPSLVGNIAEPLMWLVAFGYGMGALVGQITVNGQPVPYILFLASGSICMSAMQAASFEALYSAFSRMHGVGLSMSVSSWGPSGDGGSWLVAEGGAVRSTCAG